MMPRCLCALAANLALVALFSTRSCTAWSPTQPFLCQRQRLASVLGYKGNADDEENAADINDQVETSTLRISTAFLEPFEEELRQWLGTLTRVTRSEPIWVGSDILHIPPSEALQKCLDSILQMDNNSNSQSIELFPNNQLSKKHLFDWDWKYAMVKSLSQQDDWTAKSWKLGTSNTHPLRLQLVAIPAHTTLPAHVHPAVELDIPLLGSLYEERSDTMRVDVDLIDRAPEHSLGTPLSDFSPTPTLTELAAIGKDLTERVSSVHQLSDFDQDWTTHQVPEGQCLLNPVGSVHRSFTQHEPCLLFVLGPNVHAHFVS